MASQDLQQPPDQPQDNMPWFLKAKCPVFLPKSDALTLHTGEFEDFLRDSFRAVPDPREPTEQDTITTGVDTEITGSQSDAVTFDAANKIADDDATLQGTADGRDNTMWTANDDVAFCSTKTPLLDLFYHHDESDSSCRLPSLLFDAWAEDPDVTLKIIFNARSIHLGKGSRILFYRCAGWLATNHPLTLVANLRWLVRPVIPKNAEKTTDEDAVMVETAATLRKLEMLDAMLSGAPEMADELVLDAEHDVKNGVAHGYWKDLLNILALSANGGLDVAASQRDILYVEREIRHTEPWPNKETARVMRHSKRRTRHETVVDLYTNNPLHRAIHLTVARLFAEQLQSDLAALAGDNKKAKRNISLCGKWAPSTDRFHDRHTFVVSSIAEIMFPESQLVERGILSLSTNDDERTTYLRHARDNYRKAVAALRKHLEVVERDLSANALQNINYERVPSLAMHRYVQTFATKDPWRFEDYVGQVASRRLHISGATLLPSTLVHKARRIPEAGFSRKRSRGKKGVRDMVNTLLSGVGDVVLSGQWNTLVQRIKDSGTLPPCIAVCDVSRSMDYPTFHDGTCPLESAIGLSLLIAEVTEPPFRGAFITFSEVPSLKLIDLSATLKNKIRAIDDSYSSLNTDFEAIFTRLILPMAIDNKLKQEEMIKRIFVLSDLHFDKARN
jgi:hypothetical protein